MKTPLRLVVLVCAVSVAMATGYRAGQAMAPPPEVVGTVTIEDGDTLWELSTDLRGQRPRWEWIHRTCQLNGWEAVPVLTVGRTIQVPDWRE